MTLKRNIIALRASVEALASHRGGGCHLQLQTFVDAVGEAIPGCEIQITGYDTAWVFAKAGDPVAVMKLRYKDLSPFYGKEDYKYTIYSRTIRNEKYSYGDKCHQKATKNLKQAVRNAKEHLSPLSVTDYLAGTWDEFHSKVRKVEDQAPLACRTAWTELTGSHSRTRGALELVDVLLRMEDGALLGAGMSRSMLDDLRRYGELKNVSPDLEGHSLWFVCPVKHDYAVVSLELQVGTDATVALSMGSGKANYYRAADVPQAIQDTMATLAIMPEGEYAPQIGMRVTGGMYVFTKNEA